MLENRSPWLHQLDRTRDAVPLAEDASVDVAIVGGGIAGMMTAYFTLRDTQHTVALLEADKVAHGATGHNAGQIVSYFERGFKSMVDEFGLEMASEGQRAVESAWQLIDEMVSETQVTTPIHRFTGYAGCCTFEQVVEHLENNRLRISGGLPNESIMLAREWVEALSDEQKMALQQYEGLYTHAEGDAVRALLETYDQQYIAVVAYQKGCANSARFTEEVAAYLLATYPNRFSLFEQTAVDIVQLADEHATLTTNCGAVVTANRVVLATNGFEKIHITTTDGDDVDTRFHENVSGRIGYMSGYLEAPGASPTAITYLSSLLHNEKDPTGDAYFYFTRRPHATRDGEAMNLVCAGGPDSVLPNNAEYDRTSPGREDMHDILNDFLQSTYRHFPQNDVEYAFTWHGLMGFTSNGIRRIGVEPRHAPLMYNLGCNGVGLLPSIYGGKRIAQLLAGETLGPSIFDPK